MEPAAPQFTGSCPEKPGDSKQGPDIARLYAQGRKGKGSQHIGYRDRSERSNNPSARTTTPEVPLPLPGPEPLHTFCILCNNLYALNFFSHSYMGISHSCGMGVSLLELSMPIEEWGTTLKVLYHRQCQYTQANEYQFDGANSIETTNH